MNPVTQGKSSTRRDKAGTAGGLLVGSVAGQAMMNEPDRAIAPLMAYCVATAGKLTTPSADTHPQPTKDPARLAAEKAEGAASVEKGRPVIRVEPAALDH